MIDTMIDIKETDCAVDALLGIVKKCRCNECGQCVFGYEGVSQLSMILGDAVEKKGRNSDLSLVQELGDMMMEQSMCEDGEKLAKEVKYALANHKEEFESHFAKKECKAGVCSKFMTIHILADKCIGCGDCIDECPEDAILGKRKFIHVIEQDDCTQCGACISACEEEAIVRAGIIKPRCPKKPVPCRA